MLILLEMLGFGSIAYGVWSIDHAAGLIAAGVLACLLAYLLDRANVTFPKVRLPRIQVRLPWRSKQ